MARELTKRERLKLPRQEMPERPADARAVSFEHPTKQAQIEIVAPVPDDHLWQVLSQGQVVLSQDVSRVLSRSLKMRHKLVLSSV